MYSAKDPQSYEMDNQQQQQQLPQQTVQDMQGGVEDGQQANESNGVRGSMGSLGGPRMTGEMMYEGHGSLSGEPLFTIYPLEHLKCRL